MLDMNTNIKNYINKASEQLPDFSVLGYNMGIMFDSKSSSNVNPVTTNSVPSCALSFKP